MWFFPPRMNVKLWSSCFKAMCQWKEKIKSLNSLLFIQIVATTFTTSSKQRRVLEGCTDDVGINVDFFSLRRFGCKCKVSLELHELEIYNNLFLFLQSTLFPQTATSHRWQHFYNKHHQGCSPLNFLYPNQLTTSCSSLCSHATHCNLLLWHTVPKGALLYKDF